VAESGAIVHLDLDETFRLGIRGALVVDQDRVHWLALHQVILQVFMHASQQRGRSAVLKL
jgi:hypothetical protein